MNLGDSFNLLRILKTTSVRLVRIVTMPFYLGLRKLYKLLNPQGIANKVLADVRKEYRNLTSQKISSLSDYFVFPRYYVAKKLVYIAIVVLLVLSIIFVKFLFPWLTTTFFTKTMYVNAQTRQAYSGKVKLLDEDNNALIYKGPLENGRIIGEGILYDKMGNLVYNGGFLLELYEGEGELFYPNGKTQYKGGFVKNKYDGSGILYNENGTKIYEGEFKSGNFEGVGKQFYSNAQLMFAGEFKNGSPNGNGTIYSPQGVVVYKGDLKENIFDGTGEVYSNGNLLYSGELKQGLMEGSGVLYEDNAKLYEGGFASNQYNGKGKLYSTKNNSLIYDGEFLNSQYNGSGTLYYGENKVRYTGEFKNNQYNGMGQQYNEKGVMLYDGGFLNHQYSGSGKLFSNDGNLIYEGEFYNNTFDGKGVYYDEFTGNKIYEGEFKSGMYQGDGILYNPIKNSPIYEGGFAKGKYNGNGKLLDVNTGEVLSQGKFIDGVLQEGETENVAGVGDGLNTILSNSAGENYLTGVPLPGETADKIIDDNISSVVVNDEMSSGKTTELLNYVNSVDIKENATKINGESLKIIDNSKENMGLTVHSDDKNNITQIDIWNDGEFNGITNSITKDNLIALKGTPNNTYSEKLGVKRLISISNANRFSNRITNFSAATMCEIFEYELDDCTLKVIFANGFEGSLIMEIIPK